MLQTLRNAALVTFSGGHKIGHNEIKERFGIPEAYEQKRFIANALMYEALMINYSATREEIDSRSGSQCAYDEWYKETFPAQYERNYPRIQNREGVLFADPSDTVKERHIWGYTTETNIGPQIAYDYYQSGSSPKLGIIILDGLDVSEKVLKGQLLGSDESRPWTPKLPVRFAMIAKLSLDAPNHSTLDIQNIRVDGRVIRLTDENVRNALNYAESLYQQIKSGTGYAPFRSSAISERRPSANSGTHPS